MGNDPIPRGRSGSAAPSVRSPSSRSGADVLNRHAPQASDIAHGDQRAEAAYLALGSNVGDRRGALVSAIDSLRRTPGLTVVRVSDIIETEAVGPVQQDRFLNAVVEVASSLPPRRLLEACLAIEAAHGRVRRDTARWGPRRLDIDLLLFGSRVIDEPDLRVPHPRMHERHFVLGPLRQIAPNIRHPLLNQTIESLHRRLSAQPPVEYA